MSNKQIEQLLEGIEGLTPEFKEKAAVIFEAAVQEAVDAEIGSKTVALTEAAEARTEAAINEQNTQLLETLDVWLAESLQSWVTENAVTLDGKIKGEIAAQFVEGLSKVYEQFGVQFDDKATAHVAELESKLQEAEAKLASAETLITESTQAKVEAERTSIMESALADVVDTKRDRIKRIVEKMTFADNEDFSRKLGIVVEAVVGVEGDKSKDKEEGDDKSKEAPSKDKEEGDDADKSKMNEAAVDPVVAETLAFFRKKTK